MFPSLNKFTPVIILSISFFIFIFNLNKLSSRLAFFVINQTGYELLIYPIVTIAFLCGGMPSLLGKNIIINELRTNKIQNMITKHNIEDSSKKNYPKYNKTKYPQVDFIF